MAEKTEFSQAEETAQLKEATTDDILSTLWESYGEGVIHDWAKGGEDPEAKEMRRQIKQIEELLQS